MPVNPVVTGYLDEVDAELDAVVRLMVPPPNRLAAFHLQQAAEKLTKALRLSRGLAATTEHRVALLIDDLADTDPWKTALLPLDRHSQYATAYRYPGASGRVKGAPTDSEIKDAIEEIRELLERARRELP
jgi:HEPN domain-containing protein